MADALGILGTVADLAGLATKIGTDVPNLKRARKRDTTQRAARQGALRVGQTAVGSSQTGHGATRGLALRGGLRAASAAARESIDPISTAAAADEQRYVEERDARNVRLAEAGSNYAGMAAQIGQGMADVIASKDAEQKMVEEGLDPATGVPTEQVEPQAAAVTQGMELQPLQPQGAQDPNLGGYGQQLQAPPTTPMQAYQAAMGIEPNPVYSVAPAMEFKLRVTNLAVEEAERRGVQPAQVIAPLLRQININPMDLSGMALQDGASQDLMDSIEEGNY